MSNRVIVAGSIITDMSVSVNEHPRVGETVIGNNLTYSPGGKGANQAVSAARTGATTVMLGAIGDDGFGKMSLEFLQNQDIDISHIITNEEPTGVAMIQVSKKTGDNSIAVILGANENLKEHNVDGFVYRKGDVLVSQFEIPLPTVKRFFHKGKHANCINILNPAPAQPFGRNILNLVNILVVNETELEIVSPAKALKGFDWVQTTEDARNAKEEIFRASLKQAWSNLKVPILIVTLGDKGSYGVIENDIVYVPSLKVNAIDTTGAGDCYVGALASHIALSSNYSNYSYNNKKSLEEAMVFANKAASLSVQRKGSGLSMPYLYEINNSSNPEIG
jgi:ribokinase